MSGKQLLIDTIPLTLSMTEGKGGKLKVKGEFARPGVATANGRVYEANLWNREIKRLSEAMTNRRLVGELDHPSDGRTALRRVSHLITDLRVEEGIVVGDCEPLSTYWGKELQALINDGVQLGVSSRGYGSTTENHKGEQVVQEDYKLVSFDFVAEPANVTSYPTPYYENSNTTKEGDKPMAGKQKTEGSEAPNLDKLKEDISSEMNDQLKQMRAEFQDQLAATVSEIITQHLANAPEAPKNEDSESDDEPVLSSDELEALVYTVQEQAEKIAQLEEENEALFTSAQEAGYKYFLEQLLSNDPEADLVRKMVGDVKQYESPDDIKVKVEVCRGDLAERHKVVEQAERRYQREVGVIQKDLDLLKQRNVQLEQALEKSAELTEQLGLQLYTERRVKNHPKAKELTSLIESAGPDSTQKIDRLIEEFQPTPVRTPAALQEARANVRKYTHGGESATSLEEETDSKPQARTNGSARNDYNNIGLSLAEARALSGLQN